VVEMVVIIIKANQMLQINPEEIKVILTAIWLKKLVDKSLKILIEKNQHQILIKIKIQYWVKILLLGHQFLQLCLGKTAVEFKKIKV
jgi:hypothetical protein